MVPEKLQEIARQVYEDNSQAQETVRTLLIPILHEDALNY